MLSCTPLCRLCVLQPGIDPREELQQAVAGLMPHVQEDSQQGVFADTVKAAMTAAEAATAS